MAEIFDQYHTSYNREVDDSISFSGLKHDFFLQAKVEPLAELIAERGVVGNDGTVRALDVGCGVEALHPYVKPITRARAENPGIAYIVYSAPSLPYADGAFDLAFAVCVATMCLRSSAELLFGNAACRSGPGGIVSIIEHNPLNPLMGLAVLRSPFDADAVLISRGSARRLLRTAGLTDIESKHFLVFPFANSIARKVEGWFSGVPLGAQYICSGRV